MHDWMQETKLPTSVTKFIDVLQQMRCPQCNAGMLALNVEFGLVTLQGKTESKKPESNK
jgi:hypothetical protein